MGNIITYDINEELKENLLEYGVSVNIDRAIPFAETGLKPVHQRIIYGAYTTGALSSKAPIKSAKIVGNVIGELHPHGDISVYDALVRLAQSWALRYPLIDGQGNFGSRDGDDAAAMRYCVVGDTLISTGSGIKKIEELVKESKDNSETNLEICINSLNNRVNKTSKFFNSGKHEIFGVKLKGGLEIKGSLNHPILTLGPDLAFSWKTLEEIQPGDRVVISKSGSTLFGNNSDLVEARMLGAMISEGYITTQNRIGISNKDILIVEAFKDFWERETKSDAKISKKEGEIFEYCSSSVEIKSIFINKYEYKTKAKDKTIPQQVLDGTKEYQSEFFKFLFEGDGSISAEQISYSTYSEKMAKQIQIILLQNFGIFGAISINKGGQEFKVSITGEGLEKFQARIGFLSDRKSKVLKDACSLYRLKEKIANNSYYTIPEVNDTVRKNFKGQFFAKNTFANTKAVHKLKNRVPDTFYEKLVSFLNNFMVISVDRTFKEDPQTVYSIKVESECHSFIANGFINHNTEARLSKLAEEGMLQNIKKNVDWRDNYDETIKEPVHLPALFPNILCNPTTGIGYGMASSWMPHNLREVGQAIFDYMDGKEPFIAAPDFPTGGLIINGNDLPDIIKKGRGSVKLRGKYKIEKDSIIFTELPYGVGAEKILEELNVLTEEDESLGISEYTNQSNKNGIRVVIKGKRGTNLETLVNILFAKTSLQSSYSYNQVAIYKGKPVELGLSDIIKIYIAYNLECLKKELSFDLNKAKEREEIVRGLVKALEDIDNIIKMIKESDSAANAKIRLVERYQFTERQVKAILDMKLAKLAKLEKVELNQELEELTSQVKRLTEVLATESLQVGIIRERLANLIKKFGDDRRTEITNIEITKGEKQIETVVPESVVVIVTQNGEVKRIPKASFKTQRRAGKGVKTADVVLESISTNTVDNLLIFTDKGLMYKLLVDEIPVGTNISRGIHLSQLTKMEPNEKVVAVTSLELQNPKNHVIFITKKGLLKKTIIEEYTGIKKSTGTQAIKLKEGDSIANVTFANDEDFIVVTKKGMSIKFETKNIKAIGRVTAGVKTIKLNEGDEVLVGLPLLNDAYLGIITESGFGLKSELKEWPCQGTNGKGVACYKVTEKSGDVVGAMLLEDGDTLMLTGNPNSICIDAKEVPMLGRASLGNILIKQSKINSVIKL